MPRPDEATYEAAIASLETSLDRAAAANPNPGRTESLRRLEQWADDSRWALGRGPVVIDDLGGVASLRGLTDERGLPLGSACATTRSSSRTTRSTLTIS